MRSADTGRVERVRVGDERPRCRTTGERLQHRRFDFEEPATIQRIAQCTDHRDALPGHGAGLRAHDQVDVPLPDARLFAHLFVSDGQRTQRLAGHLPRIGQHRKFAAAGTDHLAVHEHDVAQIHLGLPGFEGILADAGQADHRL